MILKYRLLYFSGGFILGLFFLFFVFSGKKASCAYGPQARTLKSIRKKDRVFSEKTLQILQTNQMDTSAISKLLLDGSVLFSESITKMDSCNQYVIEGKIDSKLLKIKVENCNELTTVLDAWVEAK